MRAENPFASHRVRPGAIPFLFDHDASVATLVERLRQANWWGQIIGPHGSGKSTLIHALLPAIEQAGRQVVHARFQGGMLIDRDVFDRHARWNQTTQVIIDGYEQLSAFGRFSWKFRCRWQGHGLLVTAHHDLGLPTLHETRVDAALAQRVVGKLVAEGDLITLRDVESALAEHRGNLRDALFALYDLYERRRRSAKP